MNAVDELVEKVAALRLEVLEASGWERFQNMLPGAGLIATERDRQIALEGWTPEHDDAHHHGELAAAGVCYVELARMQAVDGFVGEAVPDGWPWKPSDDPVRNLVKGGALIAAEIDRIKRILKRLEKVDLPGAVQSRTTDEHEHEHEDEGRCAQSTG